MPVKSRNHVGETINKITADDIIKLVTNRKSAIVKPDHLLYADVQKEFAATAQIGFGLDGKEETEHSDFEAMRGKFEKTVLFLKSKNI